ncbi:hypothetical protein KY320_01400 [Candidatus Woesearchaeota archaeon]|nr:hypothetical protein [Candidatus Woesearchaeota archaeon]
MATKYQFNWAIFGGTRREKMKSWDELKKKEREGVKRRIAELESELETLKKYIRCS